MAKQVQIRRDTATNLNSTVPAQGELGVDITNKELRIGDGSKQGGVITPNVVSAQNNKYTYATAGGTANALTVTLASAPTSYVGGLSFYFKAIANNTNATTINVNGLGAKNVLKKDAGVLSNLVADDIFTDGVYKVTYDGVQFQIEGAGSGGITSVSQGDLNTSMGSVSSSLSGSGNSSFNLTLPGGEYGFYPQTRYSGASGNAAQVMVGGQGMSTTFNTNISGYRIIAGTTVTIFAQQRYINSSPPFDLGDGEVGGFIFALIDGNGDIQSTYVADVPPWGYNGPLL